MALQGHEVRESQEQERVPESDMKRGCMCSMGKGMRSGWRKCMRGEGGEPGRGEV